MKSEFIKRTVVGGIAIFLAVLVPSEQVLAAVGGSPLKNTRDGVAAEESAKPLPGKEGQAADSEKGNGEQKEIRGSETSRKPENTSAADSSGAGTDSGKESQGGQESQESQESQGSQGAQGGQESQSGQESQGGQMSQSGQETQEGQESQNGQESQGDQESQSGQESQSSQESQEDQTSQSSQESQSSPESEKATESTAAKMENGQGLKAAFEGEGTEESPYLIGTAKELEKLAELMVSDYETYGNRSYRLTQNLQMKKGRNNHKAIGNPEQPFMGEFDGDGYVISGVRINRPKLAAQGLFGVIGEEGIVRNVGLTENSICAGEDVGAIAGINLGTVESCFQTGEVYGVSSRVGSIAGQNRGRVADSYSTGLVCGGYRLGDYIPEAEGEEKGRKAGRGGFRDFIQTVAETIAETVAETVAYVIEETKAGLENLYEIVTTTLSAEVGPGITAPEEKGPGVETGDGEETLPSGTIEAGPGMTEADQEELPGEPKTTEAVQEGSGVSDTTEAGREEKPGVPGTTEAGREEKPGVPGTTEAGQEEKPGVSGTTEAGREENLGVPGTTEAGREETPGVTGATEASHKDDSAAPKTTAAKSVEGSGEQAVTQGNGVFRAYGETEAGDENRGEKNAGQSDETDKPEKTEDSGAAKETSETKEPGKGKDSDETIASEETKDSGGIKAPDKTKETDETDETEEPDDPDETEEETNADETDGELINDLPGAEEEGLTEEDLAALQILGGIVGINQGSIENCFQAGRRAVKGMEWTSGGIAGVNPGGQTDNCYYAWPSTLEKPEEEYDGVTAVSMEQLTGTDAAERLGLESGIWSSRGTEEDLAGEERTAGAEDMIRYRHYYPQQTVFADRGQPYLYTLGYFETDGLRVDTLSKRAYVSTEQAFAWLFESNDYLDYEIKLETDLNLASFGKSIGTMEQPFTGILDGDGHVITGLRQPLFGVLGDGSAVYYLLLDQAEIRGTLSHGGDEYSEAAEGCGVLAAYTRNTVVDSCGAVGTISLLAGGGQRQIYVGGMIGEAGPGTSVYESYAFVNMIEKLGDHAHVTAGGFAGMMDRDSGADNCYATGQIESRGTVGGFAGKNRGEIRDSFSTSIIGKTAVTAGAFVGAMEEARDGTVSEEIVEDGFITEETTGNRIEVVPLHSPGQADISGSEEWVKSNGTVTGCAYDGQMSGCTDAYAQSMITGEMTGGAAALPGGDWYMTDGAYPQLKCMALHTHETYLLRSKASAIPLILPAGITITDIPEGDREEEVTISGSVELGVPTQIDGDEIQWSDPDKVTLQGDGTAILEMN